MRKSHVAFASAVMMAAPAAANAADCKITGISAPGVSASYDPFEPSFVPSSVPISIQTQGDGCSGAKLQLAVVPSVVSPATGSQVRLVQNGSIMLATIRIAGRSQQIVNPGSAFAGNPALLSVGGAGSIAGDSSIALELNPGQVGGPGTYVAAPILVGRLIDASGQQSEVSTQLSLSTTVLPSVKIAVGSGQLSIDLGELKPGEIGGPMTFDAYANVDYSVIISSDNDFTMRRGGARSAPGVSYTPLLSNGTITSTLSGSGSSARQVVFDVPSEGLRHHSLRVQVDNFGNVASGQYSDIMTLEIRARV